MPPKTDNLRLYAVKNVSTGELIKNFNSGVVYFNSKRQAKIGRDQANAFFTGQRFAVVLGPDHKRRDRSISS